MDTTFSIYLLVLLIPLLAMVILLFKKGKLKKYFISSYPYIKIMTSIDKFFDHLIYLIEIEISGLFMDGKITKEEVSKSVNKIIEEQKKYFVFMVKSELKNIYSKHFSNK